MEVEMQQPKQKLARHGLALRRCLNVLTLSLAAAGMQAGAFDLTVDDSAAAGGGCQDWQLSGPVAGPFAFSCASNPVGAGRVASIFIDNSDASAGGCSDWKMHGNGPFVLSCAPIAYSRYYVQRAYVSYYGRPADPEGLAYWAARMESSGRSLDAIVVAFGTSAEFTQRYGGLSHAALVTGIYQQTLGRDPDPVGLAWYVGELQAGRRTPQSIALDVLNGATSGNDAITVSNRLDVAVHYTRQVAAGCAYGTDQDGLNALRSVTADVATVTAARAAVDSRCGV
jgi:hypothetical protein